VTLADLAADAADRLILDEAAALLPLHTADVVVIGDVDGALALGALAAGVESVRVHQDSVVAERMLAALGDERIRSEELGPDLLDGATVVLLRLPKSLDELDRIASLIALHAAPGIVVVAGGRLKYMTTGMNDVLARSFGRIDVSHARQKSRVLFAREPVAVSAPVERKQVHADIDLTVAAVGGVFAGTSVDIGTRALLATFDQLPAFETAIDLGSGTGILAAMLKRRRPDARVIATDASAVAVESARSTMKANDLDVEVLRDAGLASQPDASIDLIVLNPPFHDGGAVTTDIALDLFAQAARVLKSGGELWTVWNSHLTYKPDLSRLVGSTREVARSAKFTVTASRRRVRELEADR
jgi:16S rRNA (guanine1207-N2)-methyltransferase